MKQLLIALLLISVNSFGQGSRPPVPSGFDCYQCCPDHVTITITGSTLDSLCSDSVLVLTPSLGKAVRLTKPPIMKTYQDGTPMVFASGQYVKIINEFGDASGFGNGEMSAFPDAQVTPYEGASTGSFWQNYFTPFNGQAIPAIGSCDGSIYIWSTIPITGGGANATIVVTIWYEEIPYP